MVFHEMYDLWIISWFILSVLFISILGHYKFKPNEIIRVLWLFALTVVVSWILLLLFNV